MIFADKVGQHAAVSQVRYCVIQRNGFTVNTVCCLIALL